MWYSNWCPLFVQDEESEELGDWDRYAAEQYELLLAEEAYEQNGWVYDSVDTDLEEGGGQ